MSPRLKAYLLDIEGTTTPIDFVTRTLFPYARTRLAEFLNAPPPCEGGGAGGGELARALESLATEHDQDIAAGNNPPSRDGWRPYLEWLMDQDRKSTGLKLIQGLIWEQGYRSGEIKGEVYPDVVPAIRRWKAAGAKIAIFSSGSVLAQELLFGHLSEGDITPLIDGYYDTTTGPKREALSYKAIASDLGIAPEDVLFLSDIAAEVGAARTAGMPARLVVRGGGGLEEDSVVDFSSLE